MRSRLALALIAVSVAVAGLSAQDLTKKHRLTGAYYFQAGKLLTPADIEFLKGAYSQDTKGLVAPKAIGQAKPNYTSQAMKEKLQGQVEVQMIVGTDGKVVRARVIQSLDTVFGLDEAALAAAKKWTFEPGVLNGKAVPVAVTVMLEFRLH